VRFDAWLGVREGGVDEADACVQRGAHGGHRLGISSAAEGERCRPEPDASDGTPVDLDHVPPCPRFLATAPQRDDLRASPVPGSGRHCSTGTSPGSTRSMSSKKRATCVRSRSVNVCWAIRLMTLSKPARACEVLIFDRYLTVLLGSLFTAKARPLAV